MKYSLIQAWDDDLKKLRFGVFLPFYAFENRITDSTALFERIKKVAVACESLGYDGVWLDDHLMFKDFPILECWTTLSALSCVTSRIHVGTMVTCNSFRAPSLLAKMAATVDVISKGRLELGMGACAQEEEHVSYGFEFPNAAVRLERLGEAVEVIKRLWSLEKASFQGKYYKLQNAVCEPKPLQKPHPPLVIGGSGEKRTLRLVAQYSNRFDWGFVQSFEAYRDKLRLLEAYCREIGRNPKEIEKACWPGSQVLTSPDPEDLRELVRKVKPAGISMEEFKKTSLVGTPDECVTRLKEYLKLGVTYFMLYFGDLPSTTSMEVFAEFVIKKLS